MYNAHFDSTRVSIERSTPLGRIMRTTAKAMRDAQMKEDAAKRRAQKATSMSIRDKLISTGTLTGTQGALK